MNKWQYKVKVVAITEPGDITRQLEALEDWECFSVIGESSIELLAFFKRINPEWAIKRQEGWTETEERLRERGIRT